MTSGRTPDKRTRYDATHTRHYTIKLNLRTDADIISHLDRHKPVQTEIKRALRAAIARKKGKL